MIEGGKILVLKIISGAEAVAEDQGESSYNFILDFFSLPAVIFF